MLKIAVCDDCRPELEEVVLYLREYAECRSLIIHVNKYASGEALCADVQSGQRFDVIYLDIGLERMNGVQAAQIIREKDTDALLVFISSHDGYFRELIEVQPFSFIEKPVDQERFFYLLDKICQRFWRSTQVFRYGANHKIHFVDLSDVVYFASHLRQIRIVMQDGNEYMFYGKLSDVMKKVDHPGFFSPHKSYFINYSFIADTSYSEIIMQNGEHIRIAESKRKQVRNIYAQLQSRERL